MSTQSEPRLVDAHFLAARWGVIKRMVTKYSTSHGLPVETRGGPTKPTMFDLAKADAWRAQFVTGIGHGKRSRHRGDPEGHDRELDEPADAGEAPAADGDTPREQATRYKLQYQREQARKLQIDNDRKSGKLVEHSVAIAAVSRLHGEVRQQLESIPHRLAPDLAASALVDQTAIDAIRKELAARGADAALVESLCSPLTRIGLEDEFRRMIVAAVRQSLRALIEAANT